MSAVRDEQVVEGTLEEIAHKLVEQVYATKVPTRFCLYNDILSALRNERERAARVLEVRADELQAEWDAPPSAENGFIAMTADTPAGYATFYAMNQFRKLAATIREGK